MGEAPADECTAKKDPCRGLDMAATMPTLRSSRQGRWAWLLDSRTEIRAPARAHLFLELLDCVAGHSRRMPRHRCLAKSRFVTEARGLSFSVSSVGRFFAMYTYY
ncbi:hypothetical protein JG688_00006215 [Phytophthora aleatoria]|uniref:Uncharacterized protein n=1 Tax=Phytophthora aleatoria TaxID=2496075 RepID=A0A8J5M5Z9_9STRA|nr:hypothetical protein JG688_00006215 [Phytophthora aleatoria]